MKATVQRSERYRAKKAAVENLPVGENTFTIDVPCTRGHIALWKLTAHGDMVCLDCVAENNVKWYSRNLEINRAKSRERFHQNPIRRAETRAAWKAANRDRVNQMEHKRRASKRGSSGSYTVEDLEQIYALQKKRCGYCRLRLPWKAKQVDHITPLCLAGSNDRSNIQLLCKRCNLSKNGAHPIDFARSLGNLL